MKQIIAALPLCFLVSCSRFVEAMNRPHDQVTGVDEFVMAIVMIPTCLILFAILGWAFLKLGNKYNL